MTHLEHPLGRTCMTAAYLIDYQARKNTIPHYTGLIDALRAGAAELFKESLGPLEHFKDQAPDWANFIAADAHGYIKAHELPPKQTPGGLFYSIGRVAVLSYPRYAPEVRRLHTSKKESDQNG